VEFTIAIPFILVALVVVIVLGQSLAVVIALLVVFSWNSFARQVRGETLQLRTTDYVSLAKISGAGIPRILLRHILPGVLNTVLVLVSLRVGTLIITESVLSYLGVGIPPPTPAWGLMVAEGRDYITIAWWITFFPGLAILFVVLAFNFLGDWLRDKFDPRLRQL
jgi:peptide/nickel transport system permease protein